MINNKISELDHTKMQTVVMKMDKCFIETKVSKDYTNQNKHYKWGGKDYSTVFNA